MTTKQYSIVISVLLLVVSCKERISTGSTPVENLPIERVPIERFLISGGDQTIFIDTNRNSEYYERLYSPYPDSFSQGTYDYIIREFKKNNIKLNSIQVTIPYKEWVLVKKYNGKFYAYHPCDLNHHIKVSFNDTTFVWWAGGDLGVYKVVEQKIENKSSYNFTIMNSYGSEESYIIHIIDEQKGIAIIESELGDKSKRFNFMVVKEKIREFPIIVNTCNLKKPEMIFDEPDYIDLLKIK